jgi:phage baseplate assembly protein W
VPVQRISQSFRDVSASFKVNPITDDLIVVTNANAIARSIRNLIMTVPGERPFNPTLGSNVSRLLFDPMDQMTSMNIRSEIEHTINKFEERVELLEVIVNPNVDENEYDIIIKFKIIGIEIEPQQLQFALELTR